MLKALWNILTGNGSAGKGEATGNGKGGSIASGGSSLQDWEEFVRYVACALVDNPGEVNVRTVETETGCSIQIRCRKEDIGKIVGKHGKTIMAIRSLVSGAAGRQHKRVSVEVLD